MKERDYPYHYYRDHDCWAWGVRDARDGKELATGLDKGQAAAIADLLNGRLHRAADHLQETRSCYPKQIAVGHAPGAAREATEEITHG